MTKNEIKERMRKIKWATEHQTGKKLGKKGLIEVQGVVMEMNKEPEQPLKVLEVRNWQERKPKAEPIKMTVDLSSLIGKNFNLKGRFS